MQLPPGNRVHNGRIIQSIQSIQIMIIQIMQIIQTIVQVRGLSAPIDLDHGMGVWYVFLGL